MQFLWGNNCRFKHTESKYDFRSKCWSVWGFRCRFQARSKCILECRLSDNLGVVLDGNYNAKLNADLMSIAIGIYITNGPFSIDLGRHW